MKLGILGGTGDLGKGLTIRWSKRHEVLVGSRRRERAESLADEYRKVSKLHWKGEFKGDISGMRNEDVIERAELIVISIPNEFLAGYLADIGGLFRKDHIVLSPVVPFRRDGKTFSYLPYEVKGRRLSAAEYIASKIPSRVVSALHAVPASLLADPKYRLEYDVLIASDDVDAAKVVSALISEIEDLNPLYAGPLSLSYHIEALMPLILNVGIRNGIRFPSIKIRGERR
jgi:hypothetical protein